MLQTLGDGVQKIHDAVVNAASVAGSVASGTIGTMPKDPVTKTSDKLLQERLEELQPRASQPEIEVHNQPTWKGVQAIDIIGSDDEPHHLANLMGRLRTHLEGG